MNKSLGIILSINGRENFLDYVVVSLLNQTTKCEKFIIFDDSPSQSLQNNSKYGKDKSIGWIKSKKQLGLMESWNNAIFLLLVNMLDHRSKKFMQYIAWK